jgi:hypothetical protein
LDFPAFGDDRNVSVEDTVTRERMRKKYFEMMLLEELEDE